jgi:hypothetical protein
MRKTSIALTLALLAGAAATSLAQSGLRPQPSGLAAPQVTLAYPAGMGPADAKPAIIRVDYGQPHLRGRTLHTDSLVPYDKPWRTGANALTTLTTEVDRVLGTATLPKGVYVLFTLPSRAGWKLLIQKSVGQSATEYDAANDVARVDLRVAKLASPLESLTMWLLPSTAPGPARGELRIAWGTFLVSTDWSVK